MDGGLDRGRVMQYSPGVLVGNWQEQSALRGEELNEYRARKEALTAAGTGGASRHKSLAAASLTTSAAANAIEELDMLTARKLREPTHIETAGGSGLVRYGAPITIVNVKHNAALSVDLAQSVAPGPHKAAVTCSPVSAPQVRSTWVLEPCRDENNSAYRARMAQHDVLHYGQHVLIANETASEEGFYYLRSELDAGLYSSVDQRVFAALGARADNVFVVCRPGELREAVGVVGEPVAVGVPVVLLHSATNRPLCCAGTRVKTGCYGMELGVTCDYANGGNFSRTRSGVATQEENIFCFSLGEEEEGPVLRKSQAASTLAQTMPIACGDGVEDILGMVRESVLDVGGRLGFRAVARALGVAARERRRTILTREQLHAFLRSTLSLDLSHIQLDALIKRFDRSGNNVVCAQELVAELRGNMPRDRAKAVVLVYNQLVMEGEGSVEFKNMFNLFRTNAAAHPDVVDGLVSREQVVMDFETCWPGRVGPKIGTVTLDDFLEYYTDISPTIADDDRFFAMLRDCWAIPPTADYLKGEPTRHITVLHTNDTTETVKLPDTLVLDATDRKAVERLLVRHGVRDVKDFRVTQ